MGSILSDWCSVRDNLGGIHGSVSAWKAYLGIHRSYHAVYVGGRYGGSTTSQVEYDEVEHISALMLMLASRPVAPLAEWRDWYGGDLVAQEEIRTTLSQVARVVSQASLRPE